MNTISRITAAGKAFGRQAPVFDQVDRESRIIQWMRQRVYAHTRRFFGVCSHILELNAGTGIDACYFAGQGHRVLATDISEKMLMEADRKISGRGLQGAVTTRRCSFTELSSLGKHGFDYIFSNFGGLNCVDDFGKVGSQFSNLLRPGGYVTLVMISPFCFWETMFALKGNFRLAFRRLGRNGAPSHLEGVEFNTYYFRPSELQSAMGPAFRLKEIEGLATFTPPPYLEARFRGKPKLLKMLFTLDKRTARWPFFRLAGDHFIATYQYLPQDPIS